MFSSRVKMANLTNAFLVVVIFYAATIVLLPSKSIEGDGRESSLFPLGQDYSFDGAMTQFVRAAKEKVHMEDLWTYFEYNHSSLAFKAKMGGGSVSTTFPFVSYTIFQAYADVYYTVDNKLNIIREPKLKNRPPKNHDIIYVKTDEVIHFIDKVVPTLKTSFILVTHKSAKNAVETPVEMEFLNHPLLVVWFAKNPNIFHPKLIPVPIGLSQTFFKTILKDVKLCEQLSPNTVAPMYSYSAESDPSSGRPARENEVYISFSTEDNKELHRMIPLQEFRSLGFNRTEIKSYEGYIQDVKNSKFVLSPSGLSMDSYHTWESMFLGAIPIVKNSTLWPLFMESPTKVLNLWSDINVQTDLNQFKPETYSRKFLLATFWIDLMEAYRGNGPLAESIIVLDSSRQR